jgi:hypothetical protein
MKKLRIIVIMLLCMGMISGTTSCFVVLKTNHDTKRGWHKNTNNPHHPHPTNPGHTKGKHRNK